MRKLLSTLLAVTLLAGMLCLPASAAAGNPFTDVANDAYYYDAVMWARESGVTTGVTETLFQPDATCTRGQVMTFLWRAKGSPEPSTTENPFTDVEERSPFYKAILWAVENGVTAGYEDGTFKPDGLCSNAHVITFLWRAEGEPAAAAGSELAAGYAEGAYYKDAVAWADAAGLLADADFTAADNAPRATVMVYLYRNLAEEPAEPTITAAEVFGTTAAKEEANRHPLADATSNVTVNGEEVNVNVFTRDPGEYPSYAHFVYVDLVNRAIAYKEANPDEEVEVNFSMYNIFPGTYFYYDMDDPQYGGLSGSYIEGRTETLLQTLARAAKNGLVVKANIQANEYQETVIADMNALLEDTEVSGNLTVDFVMWGTKSAQQMHNKFMTVSHYLTDDGTVMRNAVYTSSTNIDDAEEDNTFIDRRERMQAGVLVSGSTGVYEAYCAYSDLVSEYAGAEEQEGFREAVRALHEAGTLNYEDEYFATYFMPIPVVYANEGDQYEDAWLSGYSPVVEYIEEMAESSGNRLFYCNTYHFSTRPEYGFGIRVLDSVTDICNDGKGDVLTKWIIETNTYSDEGYGTQEGFLEAMEAIGAAVYHDVDSKIQNHCKNYILAYEHDDEMKYVSIVGSWNLKWDGATRKANNSIAIREYGDYHPIFDCLTAQVDRAIPGTP